MDLREPKRGSRHEKLRIAAVRPDMSRNDESGQPKNEMLRNNGCRLELPPSESYTHDSVVMSGAPKIATTTITLRHAADIVAEMRTPNWLLKKILETRVVGVLAGPRSTFKSFIALHWSMLVALTGRCVVILSAEGAGIDRRMDAWMRVHGGKTNLHELNIFAVERQFMLSNSARLSELHSAIDAAGVKPDLIIVDTFSKYATGIDENDNAKVAAFLELVSASLRDHYGATVLLVAHTGHGDAKRPRGAYTLMANPDCEYIVERTDPKGMTVTVSRDRFKDSEPLPLLAYTARVVDLGRTSEDGDAVTSLVLEDVDVPTRRPQATGSNQQAALAALRAWAHTNPDAALIPNREISAMIRSHNIGAKRKPEVLKWLITAGVITQTVGGYTVHRNIL